MKASIDVVSIGTFISYLNVALIYSELTRNRLNFKWYYFLALLIMTGLNAFVIPLLPLFVKPMYNYGCFAFSLYIVSKKDLRSIFYYDFVIWFVGILFDILVMASFSVLLKRFIEYSPNIAMLIISVLLQFLLYLFFKIPVITNFTAKIYKKISLIRGIVWIYVLIISITVLFGVFVFAKMNNIDYSLLFIFFLIISIILVFLMLKNIYDEKVLKNTIRNLIENNSYYCDKNIQDRVFKHNIIHQLNSLKSVPDNKVKKLIDDLIKEHSNSSWYNSGLESLPNGINGIICRIIYGRKSKDIDLVVDNYLKSELFDVLSPKKYNKLCETLGICLDNAIVAAVSSKQKSLHVSIFEDKDTITVRIINTFNDSIEIDKLGTADYTTKKGGHGLGLYSIFSRKEIMLRNTIINNLFINNITIKKETISS